MSESFLNGRVTMLLGDVRAMLKTLPDDHFDCVVTSPPYWGLRDYGTGRWEGGDPDCDHRSPTMREGRNEDRAQLPGSAATNSAHLLLAHRSACGKCGAVKVDHQIGLEPTLGEHISVMVEVFEEVKRVLKPTGTLWLNYGDCYATSPNGRSAADTKAAGNDDRTFRDKPFSTIGAIYDHDGGQVPDNKNPKARAGQSGNKGNTAVDHGGRIRAMGGYLKAKDLCMIPNRLAIALQEAGWYVRSEIIWHKPNPMPESIRDRPTTSHEKIWLLTKSERYFYDADAIAEPAVKAGLVLHAYGTGAKDRQDVSEVNDRRTRIGLANWNQAQPDTKNIRNVWTIPTRAFAEAHFATFPPELVERCIKAGSAMGGHVLDPFGGSGTSALVAAQLDRNATLIELNPEYATLARARIEAAFMGKEEGSRHMVKQLGKDKAPFEPGSLFAGIEAAE